jgi:hypothetical protein
MRRVEDCSGSPSRRARKMIAGPLMPTSRAIALSLIVGQTTVWQAYVSCQPANCAALAISMPPVLSGRADRADGVAAIAPIAASLEDSLAGAVSHWGGDRPASGMCIGSNSEGRSARTTRESRLANIGDIRSLRTAFTYALKRACISFARGLCPGNGKNCIQGGCGPGEGIRNRPGCRKANPSSSGIRWRTWV